jgi:hypothetical protein
VTHRRREAQTGLGTVLTERYPGVWVADAADELLLDAEQRSHSPRRAFLAGHIPPGRLGRNDPGFPVIMIRGRDVGRRRVHEEKQPGYRFSGGADGSDVSPDDSGQMGIHLTKVHTTSCVFKMAG